MDISNAQRARVLVHALPYIQDYSGKIVVVKYGGNAMVSEHLKDSVIRDICLLQLIGVKVVLVHGGGRSEKWERRALSLTASGSRTRKPSVWR